MEFVFEGLSNNRRFENQHGLTITRCLALILSALNMIGSIGMIGFGIQVLCEVSYTSPIIGTNEFFYCPYIVIIIGVLTFGLTPVGFYSIVVNDSRLMIINMFGTFFISSLCVLAGGLGYNLNIYINDQAMKDFMVNSVSEEFGNPETGYISEAWNQAQQQFKCCGIDSISDWKQSKWYIMQKTYPRETIPESCCASCSDMHERYCVAFFVKPENLSNQLDHNQTICLKASNRCASADSSIANKEICLNRVIDFNYSADIYRHTNGCFETIKTNLDYMSNRLFLYSFIFFIILFLSTLTWFVAHEISEVVLPIRVN